MFRCGINIIFHTRENCVIYGAILRVYKSLQSKQIPTLNPLNIEIDQVQIQKIFIHLARSRISLLFSLSKQTVCARLFQTRVNQQFIIFCVYTHKYLSIWPYLHHLRHLYCWCWMWCIFGPAVIFFSDHKSQQEEVRTCFLAISVRVGWWLLLSDRDREKGTGHNGGKYEEE